MSNSVAHRNGVKPGDEILAINDIPCNSWNCIVALKTLAFVNSARLSIRRESELGELSLLIGSCAFACVCIHLLFAPVHAIANACASKFVHWPSHVDLHHISNLVRRMALRRKSLLGFVMQMVRDADGLSAWLCSNNIRFLGPLNTTSPLLPRPLPPLFLFLF